MPDSRHLDSLCLAVELEADRKGIDRFKFGRYIASLELEGERALERTQVYVKERSGVEVEARFEIVSVAPPRGILQEVVGVIERELDQPFKFYPGSEFHE